MLRLLFLPSLLLLFALPPPSSSTDPATPVFTSLGVPGNELVSIGEAVDAIGGFCREDNSRHANGEVGEGGQGGQGGRCDLWSATSASGRKPLVIWTYPSPRYIRQAAGRLLSSRDVLGGACPGLDVLGRKDQLFGATTGTLEAWAGRHRQRQAFLRRAIPRTLLVPTGSNSAPGSFDDSSRMKEQHEQQLLDKRRLDATIAKVVDVQSRRRQQQGPELPLDDRIDGQCDGMADDNDSRAAGTDETTSRDDDDDGGGGGGGDGQEDACTLHPHHHHHHHHRLVVVKDAAVHGGKGVWVVRTSPPETRADDITAVLAAVRRLRSDPGSSRVPGLASASPPPIPSPPPPPPPPPQLLVQEYIQPRLLPLQGEPRKWHLRVFMLVVASWSVSGSSPVTTFVHDDSLAIFARRAYDEGSTDPAVHVSNIGGHHNNDGDRDGTGNRGRTKSRDGNSTAVPTTGKALDGAALLADGTNFTPAEQQMLRRQIETTVAVLGDAASGPVSRLCRHLLPPQAHCVDLLGLDFIVVGAALDKKHEPSCGESAPEGGSDDNVDAVLIEVNRMPSTSQQEQQQQQQQQQQRSSIRTGDATAVADDGEGSEGLVRVKRNVFRDVARMLRHATTQGFHDMLPEGTGFREVLLPESLRG